MNWSSEWKNDLVQVASAMLKQSNIFNPIPNEITLSIPIQNKSNATVLAWQVGDLAVHKYVNEDGGLEDHWQVTHVLTLTRFTKAVPGVIDHWNELLKYRTYSLDYSKDTLLSWCHKVQLEHQDLWAQLRAFDSSNYKFIDADLLTKIRDWCLSVPV